MGPTKKAVSSSTLYVARKQIVTKQDTQQSLLIRQVENLSVIDWFR